MYWVNTIILAHHEAHDQPFWLLLIAATLFAAAVAMVLRRRDE
jgi:hypothetical protein